MKFKQSQIDTLFQVLDNRGYRYGDENDTTSDEFKVWNSLWNRIMKLKDGDIMLFTSKQKEYLLDMLEEYLYYNEPDENEVVNIETIINKL